MWLNWGEPLNHRLDCIDSGLWSDHFPSGLESSSRPMPRVVCGKLRRTWTEVPSCSLWVCRWHGVFRVVSLKVCGNISVKPTKAVGMPVDERNTLIWLKDSLLQRTFGSNDWRRTQVCMDLHARTNSGWLALRGFMSSPNRGPWLVRKVTGTSDWRGDEALWAASQFLLVEARHHDQTVRASHDTGTSALRRGEGANQIRKKVMQEIV